MEKIDKTYKNPIFIFFFWSSAFNWKKWSKIAQFTLHKIFPISFILPIQAKYRKNRIKTEGFYSIWKKLTDGRRQTARYWRSSIDFVSGGAKDSPIISSGVWMLKGCVSIMPPEALWNIITASSHGHASTKANIKLWIILSIPPAPVSTSDNRCYRTILWNREVEKLVLWIIVSLWFLTGFLEAMPKRCLLNSKSIGIYTQKSRGLDIFRGTTITLYT